MAWWMVKHRANFNLFLTRTCKLLEFVTPGNKYSYKSRLVTIFSHYDWKCKQCNSWFNFA